MSQTPINLIRSIYIAIRHSLVPTPQTPLEREQRIRADEAENVLRQIRRL